MSGSGSKTGKSVPAPLEEEESRKSRALRVNCRMCGCCFKTPFGSFTSGWISSENGFVAPTRKGETLPKWANLLKNELFFVVEEGESFCTRVCSPCGARNLKNSLHEQTSDK